MMFLIGALAVFLLAKWILPAIIVYIVIVLMIAVTILNIALSFAKRESSLTEIIGAIIFILTLLQFWKWV